MFKPKPITQFPREGEIRDMIAFVENMATIKAALKDLDEERARVAEAQAEAKEDVKRAAFKVMEADKLYALAEAKHAAIDGVVKAAEDKMAQAEKLVAEANTKEVHAATAMESVAEIRKIAESDTYAKFCAVFGSKA